MTPSSILLFRYSALTFNSHQIHFDNEYATKVENHPGKATRFFFFVCLRLFTSMFGAWTFKRNFTNGLIKKQCQGQDEIV